jgi:hypothetical protein
MNLPAFTSLPAITIFNANFGCGIDFVSKSFLTCTGQEKLQWPIIPNKLTFLEQFSRMMYAFTLSSKK